LEVVKCKFATTTNRSTTPLPDPEMEALLSLITSLCFDNYLFAALSQLSTSSSLLIFSDPQLSDFSGSTLPTYL
jgi:hypothetical protein